MKLVAATGNKHKLTEFRRVLEPLGVELLSPEDVGADCAVEETGATFAENARIKAEHVYRQTGMPSVADDSGLCVDALGGRPGVHSARYLGEETPHSEKIKGMLAEMAGVPDGERACRFISAICCVTGPGEVLECRGVCEGTVGHSPRGEGGFGYDPIFLVGERSFAELSGEEKDAVSHRGKALRQFARLMEEYLKERADALK